MSEDQYSITNVLSGIMELKDMLDGQDQLLRLLVRSKMSDKQNKLYEEVKAKGIMRITQVMHFLNISRNHGLTLMRKVAEQPGFSFIRGSQEFKQPSKIIYDESKILQDQISKIKEMIIQNKQLTLAEIMKLCDVDIEDARTLALNLVKSGNEYELFNGNKIRRREQL